MTTLKHRIILIVIYSITQATLCYSVPWSTLKCSTDNDPVVQEGILNDISRFPWLGIVQHSFYLGGKDRFAVTAGVLIHPGWAIASAEDIAKIKPETMQNNTFFIAWKTEKDRLALEVIDYVLHPDFLEGITMATIALLELTRWATSKIIAPIAPVCVPTKGGGSFTDLYTVRITDDSKDLEKEVYKMELVNDRDCEEFYYRSQLTYKKMAPLSHICVVSQQLTTPCVWDAGTVLITKQNFGYWILLGFGVRGPGCGAPSRFINVHSQLDWLDEVITHKPLQEQDDVYAFYLRQFSPYKLTMYKADVKLPRSQGQCEKSERGTVLFKDSSEILMNKNFGQGFYYAEVWQIAQFQCATVHLEANSRTNAAVWVEHHCHMEMHAAGIGYKSPDYSKKECFYYFKSTAYMEFRFFFSFKASIELTMYGREDLPRWIPNPFMTTETTEPWWPTVLYLHAFKFVPMYLWFWNL